MARSLPSLDRVGKTAGYLLLGIVGTAATALALLVLTQPIQEALYGAVYLQLGPSEATKTAILTHFVAVCAVALGAALLVGDAVSDRLAHRAALGVAGGVLAALVVAFLGISLAGLAAFLTALVVLAAGCLGVPLLLRYRYGVRSGGIPAFVGGIPVVVLLLLAVGFGLGWGWGYVVTAEEVPAGSVDESSAVALDAAPEFRDDLFAPGNCEPNSEGRRVCHLSLRGYEHERAAARFMARHGVRCPYQNAPGQRETETFLAQHDGRYYRVGCSPHGD